MDYKKNTIEVYDSFPDYFDEKFEIYKNKVIKNEINEVASLLPKDAKILDLGSGPGNQALFFKNKGFDILCLDSSEEMLKKCKEKGLKTIKMDFEDLVLPKQSFDIVWAYTSLLHIPKSHLPKVIEKIKYILKSNGIFMLSLKEGDNEGFVKFKDGGKRWFSLYSDREIRGILEKDFKIIKNWNVPISDKVFLDYLCVKSTQAI